ncbi:hypothetical protein LXL04_001077 [Taraxacum kok-saghyz]
MSETASEVRTIDEVEYLLYDSSCLRTKPNTRNENQKSSPFREIASALDRSANMEEVFDDGFGKMSIFSFSLSLYVTSMLGESGPNFAEHIANSAEHLLNSAEHLNFAEAS